MKEIKVQEIMIPISKCLKVRKGHSLIEVFKALDQTRIKENDASIRTRSCWMKAVVLLAR